MFRDARMPFSRQLRIIRSWLWLAVVSAGAAAAIAYLITSQAPITYTSQVSVLVGPSLGGEISSADLDVGQTLRETYAELATTRPVLQRVIAATNTRVSPDILAAAISVRVPPGGNLFTIEVTYSDRKATAALANAIAADLAAYAAPNEVPKTPSNIALTVVDPATMPTSPDDRRILRSTGLGAAIGLIFAICLAFLVENIQRTPAAMTATMAGPRPSEGRELATAVYVTGSPALEPGRRYSIKLNGRRLQVLGPVDRDPTVVALDRSIADLRAVAIDGRLVIDEPGSRSGIAVAFMSVAGTNPEGLAEAIGDAVRAGETG